jgi:Zn-finger nucleic acid-binding protein
MNCPVCQKAMVEKNFGGVQLDVCQSGCQGLWFDWRELAKLDEKNEGLGQALQAALKYPRTNDAGRGPLKCPKCGIPMHAHKYQSIKEINVDECYGCGGFFLDSGELIELRNRHMSDDEREAYTQKLIANLPAAQTAQADLDKENKRTEAIQHYTRYLRASYYATGQ